jgi:hypothetical protein
MAKKLGELMVPNGKYIKDGEEKTSWLKCGVLLQTDNGMRIKLDCIPVNLGEGWISVFEPREQAPQQQGFRDNKPAAPAQADSDVPF